MSERLNDLFTNSPCLTRSEMMAYLQGKLSGTALRQVELHLADCEFCTDALEGLKELKPAEISTILERTDERITKAVQPVSETRSFIKRLVAVAAVTVLLIATSFFLNYYFSNHKVNIAQKMQTPALAPVIQNDTTRQRSMTERGDTALSGSYAVNNAPKANGLTTSQNLKEEKQSVNAVSTLSSADENLKPDAAFKWSSTKNFDSSSASVRTAAALASSAEAKTKMEIKGDVTYMKKYSYSASEKTDKASDDSTSGFLSEGETRYKDTDYSGAITRFKKAIAINKADVEANYYAGLSEVKLKDYAKALTYFNNVLSVSGNAYYQQAQWQKAITLMQMGNGKDAQILLTQIQLQNGMYKDSASQKLRELK